MRFVLTRTWLGCAIISHSCEVCPGDELRPPHQFYFYFQLPVRYSITSVVTCCICLRPIIDDKSRKKRKRFHEEHSEELQEADFGDIFCHLSLAVTCFLLRKQAREMRTSVGDVAVNLVKCQDFKNSFRKLKMIFVRNLHYTF